MIPNQRMCDDCYHRTVRSGPHGYDHDGQRYYCPGNIASDY